MKPSGPYFLTSTRLGFRRWTEDDRDLAEELWGDPAVTRFIDARGPLSEQRVQARLRQEIEDERRHGMQYWPVFLLETGDHVGCCGVRPYGASERVLELGFHLRPRHWGRGYAIEAARAVVAYAFDSLGAAALFAGHHPANESSRSLLLKLRFRYTHDEVYEPTGLEHPSYLLTLEDYGRTDSGDDE